MAQPIQPAHGARFLFRRTTDGSDSAGYELTIRTADDAFSVAVQVHSNDNPSFDQSEAPADLVKYAETLCRQLQKSYRKNGSWPRKLNRWRADP